MKINQNYWIILLCFAWLVGCSESGSSSESNGVLNGGALPIPSPDTYLSTGTDREEGALPDARLEEEAPEVSGGEDAATFADVSPTDTVDVLLDVTDVAASDGSAKDTEEEDLQDVQDSMAPDAADAEGADAEQEKDASPETEQVTRFVAFGDQGEGNTAQYAVGEAAATVCAEKGCDFALLLGDNFYDVGVSSLADEQFSTKFELPYAKLDMPFYVILGNHDYGETSFEWYRGEFQKEYALQNPKWIFPKEYYSFQTGEGLADFFAFDTARIMWSDMVDEQKNFLNTAIGESEAIWKVAFAHHPYLSNGKHGNAGNYEGFSFIPIASGESIKDFLDEVICGKVDLYLCGHDHNRQSFTASASNCGVNFIVNGASSKSSDFAYHDDNFTLWDDDQKEGFVWLEIIEDKMTVVWYDSDGNIDFEYTIDKP